MLGVAGILVQEIVRPEVFWYESGLPQNLPEPFKNINMGGLLAWEFVLMHWVEVLRWQDYKNHGSVNEVSVYITDTVRVYVSRSCVRKKKVSGVPHASSDKSRRTPSSRVTRYQTSRW